MSAENEVREASRKFYAALNRMANGEKGSMNDVWSHDPGVTAMHPIGGRTTGWEGVRASFDGVAEIAADATLGLKDQFIRVLGDVAYELGVEQGQFKMAGNPVRVEIRVTNIYKRDAGGWRIIHHHTDTSPAMIEVLSRLPPPSA
jgi:ketosteroid isomerase-like protein